MEKAIICDIDETLIFNPVYYGNYYDFREHVLDGIPNEWCVDLVKGYAMQGYKIIFLTARDEICKEQTEIQLDSLFDFEYLLFMRPKGNLDETNILKQDYLLQLLKQYDIRLVIDDDPLNCEMFSQYVPTLFVR